MATIKKYNGSTWENTTARKYETKSEIIVPPTTIYTDGSNITTYTIKGNTVQNGTLTPANPVDVNGTGDRTKNLLKNDAVSTEFRGVQYTVNADKSVTLYGTAGSQVSYFILMGDGAATNNLSAFTTPIFKAGDTLKFSTGSSYKLQGRNTNGSYVDDLDGVVTLTKNIGLIYISVSSNTSVNTTIYPMITLSTETDTTYEPYGYKIPISSGQQTTNIYLGSTQTTRRIKKKALTGSEDWQYNQGPDVENGYYFMDLGENTYVESTDCICSHFEYVSISVSNTIDGFRITTKTMPYSMKALLIRCKDISMSSDPTTFKQWLYNQYANGTPVTVWYVLATATTAAVNEPLMKIGTYADTLSNAASIPTTEGANSISVDTTVQPSEFTATWTGWHDAEVKEKSSNLFDDETATLGKYIDNSGNEQTSSVTSPTQRLNHSDYFSVTPNSVYTFASVKDSNVQQTVAFVWYTSSKTFISSNTAFKPVGETNYELSATAPENAAYAIINYTTANDEVMLNTGSTALPYEPYWK